VGSVDAGGLRHAALWGGTAASWVDLNPAGASESDAWAVHNGQQVGYATVGGLQHAGLWSGTADSWVDLSLALSGSWAQTFARDIWSDATTTYIAGSGFNNLTGRWEALLWTQPVPEPSSLLLLLGSGSLLYFVRRRGRTPG
jgi:hypothetical protein